MTKITIPEAPTVEQAAKALIDALEARDGTVRPAALLNALRALAGDA